MPRVDYDAVFRALLGPCQRDGVSVSVDALFAEPALGTATRKTKMTQLKRFLSGNMEFFGCVQGVLPPVSAIIDLAETELGTAVSEANVVAANRVCANLVTKAAAPVLEEFVRSSLDEFICERELRIPLDQLVEFLVGEFATFTKGAGNGLVSVAGAINEKLLVRCLINRGLRSDHFSETGTESEGDIIIHSGSARRTNLGVEIKSYHARERLLRGLRDTDRPKVAAGYFIDPSEFNPTRTIHLLQTQAAAIYMPEATLSDVDPRAAEMTTNEAVAYGSRFYRPLESFASDMLYFVEHGELPPA